MSFSLRNKEILPFAITCMSLKDTVLNEISRHRKTNTACLTYNADLKIRVRAAEGRMLVTKGWTK